MKVLIGTNNKAKIKKYSTILNELQIEYCTPEDLKLNMDIAETGTTPEENSKIKVKAYYEATHMPTIVDDSALIIDGLPEDKQPGVFVRRHNGKRMTDEESITLYSKEIEELGGKTTGTFIIALSVVDKNCNIHTNVINHDRVFVSKPCKARNEGYPMNSLIYNEKTGKYLAETYEGQNIYKGSSFEKDYEFIKSVLLG